MTPVTCRLTAKNKNSRTLRSVIEYGLPLPFTICFGQSCRVEVVGAKNEILKPNFRLQMPFKGVSLAFTKFSGLVETFTLGQLLIFGEILLRGSGVMGVKVERSRYPQIYSTPIVFGCKNMLKILYYHANCQVWWGSRLHTLPGQPKIWSFCLSVCVCLSCFY